MSRPLNGVERKQRESQEAFQRMAEAAASGRTREAASYLAQGNMARNQAKWMSE